MENAYKEVIRIHLRHLLDSGLTQREIAAKLEFENANNISMLMSKDNSFTLAAKKLPLLQKACDLSSTDAFKLVRSLMDSSSGGGKLLSFDTKTFDWLTSITLSAFAENAIAFNLKGGMPRA